MKRLLYLLTVLLFLGATYRTVASPVLTQFVQTTSTLDPCTGYVICQNFEGTGYDNAGSETWNESGSPDPDYETTVLRGSQSLYLFDNGADCYVNSIFTGMSEIYFFFRFRTSDVTTQRTFLRLRTSFTDRITVAISSSSTMRMASSPGISVNGTYAISPNTTYFVWGYGLRETGDGSNDGIYKLWINTSNDFDTAALDIDKSDGQWQFDQTIDKIHIVEGTATLSIIFDQVLVKATAIGDVPN